MKFKIKGSLHMHTVPGSCLNTLTTASACPSVMSQESVIELKAVAVSLTLSA